MAEQAAYQVDPGELRKFRDQLLQAFVRGHSAFEQVVGLDEEDILGMARYARQLAEEGQLEGARELLATLTELEPPLGYVFTCLGAVEMQLDQGPAAIRALRRALELNPHDVAANTHLGELYLERGDFDRCAEYLRTAITLDVAGIDPFANRARALSARLTAVAGKADKAGERGSARLAERRGRIALPRAAEAAR